jgi:hypothetical protein
VTPNQTFESYVYLTQVAQAVCMQSQTEHYRRLKGEDAFTMGAIYWYRIKCFVLFCFVLFCFVLFCFVLFCFVLFCFVLFDNANKLGKLMTFGKDNHVPPSNMVEGGRFCIIMLVIFLLQF